MIKKIYGKDQFFNEVAETLAMTSVVAGGGYHLLGCKRLFRIIEDYVFTPLLRFVIAMNKQYMTGLTCQCELLISPFDNRILSCNRAAKT